MIAALSGAYPQRCGRGVLSPRPRFLLRPRLDPAQFFIGELVQKVVPVFP